MLMTQGQQSLRTKYWDINFCTGFPLPPPWRGRVKKLLSRYLASVHRHGREAAEEGRPPPTQSRGKERDDAGIADAVRYGGVCREDACHRAPHPPAWWAWWRRRTAP